MTQAAALGLSALAIALPACGGGGPADPVDPGTIEIPALPASSPTDVGCTSLPAASDILAALNTIRATARNCGSTRYPAAAAVRWSTQLEAAAQAHSQDMASKNYFDHTGLDGSGPAQRARAQGYPSSFIGENIAAGQQTLRSTLEGWLTSPGHCANLMSADYQDMGLACAQNPAARYVTYWTLVAGAK